MAITDELREYAHDCCARVDDAIHAIADRIDEQNAEAQRRWMVELDALRKERDEYLDSIKLWETKCETMVELPRGADGEPIHIGDVMEWVDEPGNTFEVIGVGDGTLFYANDLGFSDWTRAGNKRHYHEPTVEDVLTDLCEHVWESALLGTTWSDSPVESYIAEYAAKMRLVESDDE